MRGVPVTLVLWDGTAREGAGVESRHTVRIGSRRTLWRLAADPDLAFGEGFTSGDLQVDGDVYALVDQAARALARRPATAAARLGAALGRWAGASTDGARRNARHHYDLGNDFYRLWLDDQLVYTCACFPSPEATLEAAQVEKMDRVCRKLDLEPGVRVFEAGCGWGALACYMAATCAARVRAWNVSHEQVLEARARARHLGDRVTIVEDDWRRIDGQCDVFVSLGMIEHVGAARYGELGAVINRCLDREHGRGLLHFIGRAAVAPPSRWTRRHVFPGYYLPTLGEVLARVLEPHGLSVLDVENLRRHYALTLEHWRDRFEEIAGEAATRYGDAFTRMWRYYLAGAHAGFEAGYLQLFQVTFAREGWAPRAWGRVA